VRLRGAEFPFVRLASFTLTKRLGYQPETPSPVEGTPPRLQLGWGLPEAPHLTFLIVRHKLPQIALLS
jgi:hypothetical protein